MSHDIRFITGRAGCGKTHRAITEMTEDYLSDPLSRFILTGPTHLSVKTLRERFTTLVPNVRLERITAGTIYSVFRIPPMSPSWSSFGGLTLNITGSLHYHLIIDEIGLIDIRIFRKLLRHVSKQPFRKIYLVGDPSQLQSPSVSIVNPIRKISFRKLSVIFSAVNTLGERIPSEFVMKHLAASFVMMKSYSTSTRISINGPNQRCSERVRGCLDIIYSEHVSRDALTDIFVPESHVIGMVHSGWTLIVNSYDIISRIYAAVCRRMDDRLPKLVRKSSEHRFSCPLEIRPGGEYMVCDRSTCDLDRKKLDGGWLSLISSRKIVNGDRIVVRSVDEETDMMICDLPDGSSERIFMNDARNGRSLPIIPWNIVTPFMTQGGSHDNVLFWPLKDHSDPVSTYVSVTRAREDLRIVSDDHDLSFIHRDEYDSLRNIIGEM